jgi:hypothetical protein
MRIGVVCMGFMVDIVFMDFMFSIFVCWCDSIAVIPVPRGYGKGHGQL